MKVFLSYSHKDQAVLERLKVHLRPLQRAGKITAWYDHEIRAGGELDKEISEQLEASDLFLLLISPDFLNSDYCVERELARAMERHEEDTARVIPIIVEPCHWQLSDFKKLKALPKDAKPISDWTNDNTAYLNIVQEIVRVVEDWERTKVTREAVSQMAFPDRPARDVRNYRVKRDFDEIDRGDYRDQAFEEIRTYFQEAIAELEAVDGLRGKFVSRGDKKFSCTVVNRQRTRSGSAHITVFCSTGRHGFGDITYVFQEDAREGTANGGFTVGSDEYEQFLRSGMMSSYRAQNDRMTPKEAAEALYTDFLGQAGVEYG